MMPLNFIYLPWIRDTGIANSLLCLVLRLFAASLVVCVGLYVLGDIEGCGEDVLGGWLDPCGIVSLVGWGEVYLVMG
jgi:hypothetical protein